MLHGEEPPHMALLRLKRAAQITIPVELRKRFNLEEGDYLEAEAVEEGILLKPVTVMEREQARQALRELLANRRAAQPAQSPEELKEEEEAITHMIKEMRQEDAARRS